MHAVDREAFEILVQQVVEELPEHFRERIENLHFSVEEQASRDDHRRTSTSGGGTLLGAYRGVPLPSRTSQYNLALPDTIVIFQQPLQRIASDHEHLCELVKHTVHHEIAHYFGINDRRLGELGAY